MLYKETISTYIETHEVTDIHTMRRRWIFSNDTNTLYIVMPGP